MNGRIGGWADRPMAFLAAGVFFLVTPLVAQEFPRTPPAPLPLTPAPFPPFQEAVLPNGLRLLVVESRKYGSPIVTASMISIAA